jgi:acid phosphatase
MHNGDEPDTIIRGDAWLKKKIDAYLRWAEKNNSLLIVTFDEDDFGKSNQIATIFVGPMVKPGVYARRIDHYSVLRTLLDMYGLPPLGRSTVARQIDEVWTRVPAQVR